MAVADFPRIHFFWRSVKIHSIPWVTFLNHAFSEFGFKVIFLANAIKTSILFNRGTRY